MSLFNSIAVEFSAVLAGRGAGRLIEGLFKGDPVAWGITGVVVAVFIGIAVFKRATGNSDDE